jgi:hypothetical protein
MRSPRREPLICRIILAFMIAAAALPRASAQTADSPAAVRSRLLLNEQPAGEKFFALTLVPSPDTFQRSAKEDQGLDVAALVDTSASQTGPYRTDTIAALRTFLASLGAQDRVKLMAVDLNAVDLTEHYVAPQSREMQSGLAKLDLREPLGATDMAAALEAAANSFDANAARPRAVVYFGDGMSKANFLTVDELAAITEELVAARAPLHSYAIGPQRDLQLLATLANHTGGMLYVDAAEAQVAQQAGAALATVVRSPVFWPSETELPRSMKEAYPRRMPPLRPDRVTVVVGVFEGEGLQSVRIQGQVAGSPAEARWTLSPENSADDLAYLPQLVDLARRDGGVTLPTLGDEGLREVGRLLLARGENLAKMGARELAGGDLIGAQKLIEAARKADPNSPQAAALGQALQKAAEANLLQTPAQAAPPAADPDLRPAAKKLLPAGR